uniref:Transposase n=1 Tax=Candidatus Nitrotoga fabula TaxID=2182327 RepID=A0A2X0QV68_9PROT|nr:protein of unknown function [Candidatus Nitrotoga fabula]
MNKQNKFSPEVKERAVRLVQEHRGEYLCLPAINGESSQSAKSREFKGVGEI